MTHAGRVYGGRSEAERRAERRARLVAAGLELFGTDGWTGTTIERLCAVAGVATRAFYEEFSGREALLLAVYEDVMDQVASVVVPRVAAAAGGLKDRVQAAVGGYVDQVTHDPRRARVVHREVRVAGVLEADRQRMLTRFADLIVHEMPVDRTAGGGDRRLLALALAGAVTEVLADWVSQAEPRADTGPLVDALVAIFVAVLRSTKG